MDEYYPNFKDNELFIYLIKELPPRIREEKDTITKLFELINNLNSVKDKLVLYSTILPKETLLKIFKDVKTIRNDIFNILESLKFSEQDINKLLINLGSKLNSKILASESKSSETDTGYVDEIEYSDDFIEKWNLINEILTDKLKLSENLINKDKELFIDVLNLIQFSIKNKIVDVISVNRFKPLNDFIKELEDMSKSNLTRTLQTKKGNKVVPLNPGGINSNIKFRLIEMKSNLEILIKNSIITINSDTTNDLKSKVESITDNYTETFTKDYNYLISNYTKALNIMEFLYDISKDLSDNNINSKYDKFIEYIYHSNMTIDDLYYATNLFNTSISTEGISTSPRQNALNIDSNFFVQCNKIVSDSNIKDNNQKQLILEKFILTYEKEFILNLINNIDHSINNYKLLSRIYRHSTPNFNNRIEGIIRQHLNRNLELYYKNINDYGKLGDNLALALFLVIDVKDISNILFSKVIKIIGSNHGIKQTQLIGQ